MKHYLSALLVLLLFNFSQSQNIKSFQLDSILNKPYEFSSIAIQNDTIFIVTENCNTVFYLDKKSKHVIGQQSFMLETPNSDIEGMSIFKNFMFISDESDNSIAVIDLKRNEELPVTFGLTNKAQNLNHDFGFEGIEINAEGNYVYLLKEMNKKFESEIYGFHLNKTNDGFYLKLDRITTIAIGRKYRYADLALSPDESKLYLLRSKIGGYYIDTLPLENNKLPEKSTLNFKELVSLDISNQINNYSQQGYSSNLEGLTVYENSLFLISDNYHGRDNTCDDPVSKIKTLMVELKF